MGVDFPHYAIKSVYRFGEMPIPWQPPNHPNWRIRMTQDTPQDSVEELAQESVNNSSLDLPTDTLTAI
jgi:hypothetical protein